MPPRVWKPRPLCKDELREALDKAIDNLYPDVYIKYDADTITDKILWEFGNVVFEQIKQWAQMKKDDLCRGWEPDYKRDEDEDAPKGEFK